MSIIISVSIDEKVAKHLTNLRKKDINISRYINRLIYEDMRKNGD